MVKVKNIKIILGILKVNAIGHIWANPLNTVKLVEDFPVILFYLKEDLCSKRALQILKDTLPKNYRVIGFNQNILIFIRIFIKILRFIPFKTPFEIIETSSGHIDKSMMIYGSKYYFWKYDNKIKLNYSRCITTRENLLKKIFNELNLDLNFYVLVFARDYKFRGKNILEQARNTSFEDLIPMINLLIKNKIPVIRVGRSKYPREDFFKSKYYKDISWISIDPESYEDLLFANSSCIIANNSGITQLQRLEDNNMLIHNWIPYGLVPFFKNTIYSCQHVFYDDKEIMPNLLPRKLWLSEDISEYRKNGFNFKSNSNELLISCIKELIDLRNHKIISTLNTSNQNNPNLLPFVYGGESLLAGSYINHLKNLISKKY